MNTLNAVIATGTPICALIFCWLAFHLIDSNRAYSLGAQIVLALTGRTLGVTTIIGFGYSMVVMQVDAVAQGNLDHYTFAVNVVCAILITLTLGGIEWFTQSVTEFSLQKMQRDTDQRTE